MAGMQDSEAEYIEYRRKQAQELTKLYEKSIAENEIVNNRIVFSTFEGDGGFCCNPKYIAEEFIKRGGYELVWLTHKPEKHKFPSEIRVMKDSTENSVYWLSTAKVWIDNYRKPWGTVKRAGQIYVQTWHGCIGFKPSGLYRGDKFPKIARLVTEADVALIDYMISDSDWCDKTYPKNLMYGGKTIRSGSPRCDCLIKGRKKLGEKIKRQYDLPSNAKVVTYAPTFRAGSQKTKKNVEAQVPAIDFKGVQACLEKKFGGEWYTFLRLHPQLSAKLEKMPIQKEAENMVDVSQHEDMSELLAASDALITDYSSCAFDALCAHIPVFWYADDMQTYVEERGKLLWEKEDVPFVLAKSNDELKRNIEDHQQIKYVKDADEFMQKHGVFEKGNASTIVVDKIEEILGSE